MTISWIHLSDFHFEAETNYEKDFLFKQLLKHIQSQIIKLELKINFIVVTGDIADLGNKPEYQRAIDHLKDLTRIGGVSVENILLVPGNHDAKWEDDQNNEIEKLYKNDQVFGSLSPSNIPNCISSRFDNYSDFLKELNPTYQGSEFNSFFKTITIGNINVAFIGLNSAWLCTKNITKELSIGREILFSELSKSTEVNPNLTIFLIHHPPNYLRIEERQIIEEQLSEYDLILCGHKHSSLAKPYGFNENNLLCIGAGKIGIPDQTNEYKSYNFVKFQRKNENFWIGKVFFFRYEVNNWVNNPVDGTRHFYEIAKVGKHTTLVPQMMKELFNQKITRGNHSGWLEILRRISKKPIKELLSKKEIIRNIFN